MVKKVYRTMQGREVDMDALLSKNETMPAVGNAKMNARGDELGAGGKIIRKREEVAAAYYEDNPNARTQASAFTAPAPAPVVQTEQASVATTQSKKK